MSRPFGAALSIGHTRIIVSPSSTKPCKRVCSPSTSSGVKPPNKSSNSNRFASEVKSAEPMTVTKSDKPVWAVIYCSPSISLPTLSLEASTLPLEASTLSLDPSKLFVVALISLIKSATGTLFCFKRPNQCISSEVGSSSVRST